MENRSLERKSRSSKTRILKKITATQSKSTENTQALKNLEKKLCNVPFCLPKSIKLDEVYVPSRQFIINDSLYLRSEVI